MKKCNIQLAVKRTRAGLGLFTLTPIKKGRRIVEYTGEIISREEADRRGGKYLFEINSRWYIDGKGRENLARYVNHACKPNCEPGGSGKKIFIYAKKHIYSGEELTYDYGEEYFETYIQPLGCRCSSCLPA